MDPPRSTSPLRFWGYLLPPGLLAGLAATYTISPRWYLRHVLEPQHREYQLVEMLTFAAGLLAGVLLAWAGARLWAVMTAGRRAGWLAHRPGWRGVMDGRGGAGLVLIAAAATLFFAGEEVNWGQTFADWGVPERDKPTTQAVNLHNNVDLVSPQVIANVYLVTMFFLMPAAWALRDRLPVPRDWAPAVPAAPVVAAMAWAFAVSFAKTAYRGVVSDYRTRDFYMHYVEQLNEQKELLVAVALLLYAIDRVWAASRPPGVAAPAS